jgi:hypothetical protein
LGLQSRKEHLQSDVSSWVCLVALSHKTGKFPIGQVHAEMSMPLDFDNESFKSASAGILIFLSLIRQYGMKFITIRRRGKLILDHLSAQGILLLK